MKIVVMSDSHRNDAKVEQILKLEPDADGYLHCGDLCSEKRKFPDIVFVLGNCDYDDDLPRFRTVTFGQIRILMCHGDRIFDRDHALARMAKDKNCQIVVHGHTHIPSDIVVDGIRILNPGALSYNRDFSDIGYIVINTDGTSYTVERKIL